MADEELVALLKRSVIEWNTLIQINHKNKRENGGFSSVDLENADLQGADLQEANLQGVRLRGADLRKAHLRGANLQAADLQRANLEGAYVDQIDRNSTNSKEHIKTIRILSTVLEGASLREANLRFARLQGVKLQRADLQGADLSAANLPEADLEQANLRRASLPMANLKQAHLYKANLQEAHLWGARLGLAQLQQANLRKAKLLKADLQGANLQRSILNRTNLHLATLDNAELTYAQMQNTDLTRATLFKTNLDHANLTGSHFWGANLTKWSINGVICERAYWDEEGRVATEYGPGEFERAYAEKPTIVLRYNDSLDPVDLAVLPLIVEKLQDKHAGCKLHIRSIKDAGSGAEVEITVENADACPSGRSDDKLTEIREQMLYLQGRQDEMRALMLPYLKEAMTVPKQQINIGEASGFQIGDHNKQINQNTSNDLPEIAKLLYALKSEPNLPEETQDQIKLIEGEITAGKKDDGFWKASRDKLRDTIVTNGVSLVSAYAKQQLGLP